VTTIQLYGRLYRGPEERTTGAGKPMVTSAMVVDLGRGEEQPEWFSLVSFGRISEVLAKHARATWWRSVGGSRSRHGRPRTARCTTGFSVLVDGIASARTVRPGKAKVKCDDTEEATFDDAIPF